MAANEKNKNICLADSAMGDLYYRLAKQTIDGLLAKGIISCEEHRQLELENRKIYKPFLYELWDEE